MFIQENECEPFKGSGFPDDLTELPVLFEAFGEESRLVSRTRLIPDRAEVQIAEIFSEPQVQFINLRNAEAGCFIATVERTEYVSTE